MELLSTIGLLGYIILFSLVGGVLSLVGGLVLLTKKRFPRSLSIHLISFAAGALLGAVFFDLLPEAVEEGTDPERLFLWVLAGFTIFFLIEGLFLRFHHHHEKQASSATPWLLLFGDSIHNLLDGVAIAVAFLVSLPVGIVTALATAAHEIPQEIGDFSVMLSNGWKKKKVLILNTLSALMTTVGAVFTFAFRDIVEPHVGILLALAAGFFIYIGAADLIPEVYHREQGRDKVSHVMILFILGVVTVGVITKLVE